MSSRDFHDILNDCIERMAAGQSLEACLRLYPAEAEWLRPLLEAGGQVRRMLPEAAEIRADQGLVWGRIEPQLERQRLSRRRKPGIGRLLLAAALLTGLLGGAYFALNRPQQDTNLIEPLVTTSPTHTHTATTTFTPTLTHTPSPMPSATPSVTPSPTPTATETLTPLPTVVPSATPFPTVPPITLLPPTVPSPTEQIDNSGSGSANSGSGSDDDDDDDSGHGGSDDSGDDDDDGDDD